MTNVIILDYPNHVTCGCCLYDCAKQYSVADADTTPPDEGYGGGLCAECFMDMVAERSMTITVISDH